MVDAVTWVTVGGFTLLFFFWAYGILAFARDLRRYLPRARAWWRARRREDEAEPSDQEEPAEDERYLL